MTTHRYPGILGLLLLATGLVALAAGPVAAQAPCPQGETPAVACTFLDDGGMYQWFIRESCNQGLMAGCGGDYFCSEEGVTREDMAVHLEKLYRGAAFNPQATCASACTFTDLTPSYCLAGWICQLSRDDITSGCGGGAYCGPDPVTRAQMAVFLGKVISRRLPETIPSSGNVCLTTGSCRAFECKALGGTSAFDDVPADSIYCASIHYMLQKAITMGCGGWNYCPWVTIARQEMAVFLGRAYNLIKTKPFPPPDPCQ